MSGSAKRQCDRTPPRVQYVVRLRATNGAGRSAWASAAVITRQLPVDDGGTGPLAAAAAEATYRSAGRASPAHLRAARGSSE